MPTSSTRIFINEINADSPGSDQGEFVELFGPPFASLEDLVLVFFNGNNDASYSAFDLDGYALDENGFFVAGNAAVPNVDLIFSDGSLQNGPDAVALYVGNGSDFSDDTPLTTDNLVEARVYGSGDCDDAGLVSVLGFQLEEGGSDKTLARYPDGGTFGRGEPTPGTFNMGAADHFPMIHEFVANHTGVDQYEYIEVFGKPRRNLSTYRLLLLDGEVNPGEILWQTQVGTTGSDGFWYTGFLSEIIPNGSLTLLLTKNAETSLGQDLDSDDDGILDARPWCTLADGVAVHDGDPGDLVYAPVILGTESNRAMENLPGGASRAPYGRQSYRAEDWRANNFEGVGLPGFSGEAAPGEAINTPGRVTRVGIEDYYAAVDRSTGAALRVTLHELIASHVGFPYNHDSHEDTWDVLERADEDPLDTNRILTLYQNASHPKVGGGTGEYNREHTWPKSYGFPEETGDGFYPYTDLHHLRLATSGYNSQRNNYPYDTCNPNIDPDCREATTILYNGQGGGEGIYPGNSNWLNSTTERYQVWNFQKGNVARGLLYMAVRFQGGRHGITGTPEPGLELVEDLDLVMTGNTNMGRLSVLLQWHAEDPVDDLERRRNETVYEHQGNRNPFIDFPRWANCIFLDDCSPISHCLSQYMAQWRSVQGTCFGGIATVRDFIAILNHTCVCAEVSF
ncbi:MAG: endonuclease [Acidobacteriota bacterium]|nr:endonuclease [Acidobacteriota bacterium]